MQPAINAARLETECSEAMNMPGCILADTRDRGTTPLFSIK